jgi:aryl-alcohol dehydrogenase-like predicted oxidoreductase
VFQRFDLLEQSARPLLREARAHDMGVILGSPLRLGLFGSARDELLARCGEDDRRQVAALEALLGAEPGGVPGAAIRFALTPPEVSVVLSGAATPEEIESAVGAAAGPPLAKDLVDEVYRLGAGKERTL